MKTRQRLVLAVAHREDGFTLVEVMVAIGHGERPAALGRSSSQFAQIRNGRVMACYAIG